jgi:hypothetical protein
MSGVFYIGLGEQFDEKGLQAIPPGAVVVLPGNTPHFHWAKSGEYVTQVTAFGPIRIGGSNSMSSGGFVSRGFHGRRQQGVVSARLPPGQYLEQGFPVLSAGPTPHMPLDRRTRNGRGSDTCPDRTPTNRHSTDRRLGGSHGRWEK